MNSVHEALTNISLIKKERNSKSFDATIADATSAVRVVGFNPHQQMQLSTLYKSSSPVELAKCEVKKSCQGQGYDIMKSNTQIFQ